MNSIISLFSENKKVEEYLENIKNKVSPISLLGLTDVTKICMSYAAKELSKRPICIITYNEIQAKKLVKDLKYFNENIVYIPKKEIVTYDYIAESKDLLYERIEALNRIQIGKTDIIVTTIEAVMQPIISKDILYKEILEFIEQKSYDLEDLKVKLVNLGYERSELIEGRGQFSIRGGIVDIAISNSRGVRIEFWGDEVDSIRIFNISSQRSIENLKEIKIYPAHEYILEKNVEEVCNEIINRYNENEQLLEDIEQIKNGNYAGKIDKYFECFYTKKESILKYLSNKYLIFIDEEAKVKARSENIIKDNNLVIKSLIDKEKTIPNILEKIY